MPGLINSAYEPGTLIPLPTNETMSADPNDTGFSETHRKSNATPSFQTNDSQDNNQERYPATPLQLGMLLHSIVSPGEGVYVQQKILTLRERLDLPSFEQALFDLASRHTVLRSAFELEAAGRATQVVDRHPKLRLVKSDWRPLPAKVQQAKLRTYLNEDKRHSFDFAEGPPVRYALFRTADAEYEFIWSSHHALMDGRSYLILLSELFELYEARVAGDKSSLPVRRPFADYSRGVEGLNNGSAEAFWRARLAGVTTPTPLKGDQQLGIVSVIHAFADTSTELPIPVTANMIAVAQSHQITVNSFVQAAWALLLSRTAESEDVLFGMTKSCRGLIEGGDDIVGLCINTIPFRARVDRELTVIEFTKQMREEQLALRGHEHVSLLQIREWSEIPRHLPFFESVVVFEDFLINTRLRSLGGGWTNRQFRLEERSNYALTLSAYLDSSLIIKLGYDQRRFSKVFAERIVHYYRTLLEAMVTRPESRLVELLCLSEPAGQLLCSEVEVQDSGSKGECREPGQYLETVRAQENYWVDRLAQVEVLELNCMERQSAGSSAATGFFELRFEIPGALLALESDSRSESLLTIILAFLVRITGGEVGDVELRWRNRSDINQGFDDLFAAYRPFRTPALEGGCTLLQLSEDVRRQLRSLAEHKTYLRDVWARNPKLLSKRFVEDGLPISIELVDQLGEGDGPGTATLHFEIPRDNEECRCWVAEDCADRSEVEALRGRFAAFLTAADPSTDLAHIPILSDEDHKRLEELNDTVAEYPSKCTSQLFMEQARIRPAAPALVFEGLTLSYGELDRRSSSLAAFLLGQGIGHGSLVGIYMERSVDLVVSLLAVMKTGAAYVPMDPTYPAERIAYMLSDTDLPLVLTQSSLRRNIPDCGPTIIALDEIWDTVSATHNDGPFDRATIDGLTYVIYTSGSTGKPKGVQVRHRAVTNLLCSMARTPGFTEHDKLLAVTTISFDIAALEIYLPLITGGVVELAPASVASDGFELRRRIEESRPTVMQATPATWQMLRAAGWAGDSDLRVFCGGEALPRDLASYLVPLVKEVWNLYGPTETTIWSSISSVKMDRKVTIGRPIANTRFYVLDRSLRLVPPGVPGELYIGGDGVSAGYLHRPELTAERFLPCPFAKDDSLMYGTGDLVRVLASGNVEYLQRVDRQVKLHGYRIELGEIEHVLLEYPSVHEAVVIVREDTAGDRRLVAYIMTAPESGELPTPGIRRFLKSSLPEYMIPGVFVAIDRVPLTPNGKVDYKALPQPSAAIERGESVQPMNGTTEESIASIWRSVLGHERFGPADSFFEVGGNSLLVMEVVKRLRDEFREPMTTVDIFAHPTITSMALHLKGESGDDHRHSRSLLSERVERYRDTLGELRRTRLRGKESSAASG